MTKTITNELQQTVFFNDFCSIRLTPDNTFFGQDKTDAYNEPRMYTKNSRSYKKGLKILAERFNPTTTMYQVARMLDEVGLKSRTYCAID